MTSPSASRDMLRKAKLKPSMPGGLGGDAEYGAMLSLYEATLSAPPPLDETPDRMVDMIATMFEG